MWLGGDLIANQDQPNTEGPKLGFPVVVRG